MDWPTGSLDSGMATQIKIEVPRANNIRINNGSWWNIFTPIGVFFILTKQPGVMSFLANDNSQIRFVTIFQLLTSFVYLVQLGSQDLVELSFSVCQRGIAVFESSAWATKAWFAWATGNQIPMSMMKTQSPPQVQSLGNLPGVTESTTMPTNATAHMRFGDIENKKSTSRPNAWHNSSIARACGSRREHVNLHTPSWRWRNRVGVSLCGFQPKPPRRLERTWHVASNDEEGSTSTMSFGKFAPCSIAKMNALSRSEESAAQTSTKFGASMSTAHSATAANRRTPLRCGCK